MTAGHNSINAEAAKRWFGEVRRSFEEEETERASWRGRAAAIKERRKDIYERAESDGIPAKLLKARIKQWVEDKRIAEAKARRDECIPDDADDRATFEQLCEALGEFKDTPLGTAAVDAAKAADDDDKDLRPRHLQDLEQQRIEENARRIREGITGLPGADAETA